MSKKQLMMARTVSPEEGVNALQEVVNHLQDARLAIARLMPMENIRTDEIFLDDDYLRRLIRSLETRRRKIERQNLPFSKK